MSLRIVNRTPWRSDHLRAFVVQVRARMFAADEFKGRKLVVTFVPSRRYITGVATIKGNKSTIRIPSCRVTVHAGVKCPDGVIRTERFVASSLVDRARLASVIAHEMAHNAGMSNERIMRGRSRMWGWAAGWRDVYAWALDLPLARQADREADPVGREEEKLARAEEALARWESKAKRAATAIAKYRRRVAFYQKRVEGRIAARGRDGQ